MGRVPVNLWIGPAGNGKTELCLQALRERASQQALSSGWALLPDRSQALAFRRRLATGDGVLGVRVETPSVLAEEVLIRADGQLPRASSPIRLQLVSSALRELDRAGELSHFGPIAVTPGLAHALADRIAELRWGAVTPQAVLQAASDQPQITDLAAVYRAYLQRLESIGWEDEAGLTARAAHALRRQPAIAAGWDLVVVDGFTALEPAILDLLQALAETGIELVMTLPGQPGDGRPALQGFQATLEAVMLAFPDAEIRSITGARQAPPLAALEALLFTPDVKLGLPADPIQLLATRSPLEEVQEALRWLKANHVRHGVPLDRMALLMTEPERYLPSAAEVAREYGLPLRLQAGLPMGQSPPVVVLLDLLALIRRDWPRGLTLDLLRSPYLDLADSDLGGERLAQLEAATYWGQVVGGAGQWEQALEGLAGRTAEMDDQAWAESAGLPLPSPQEAQQLLQAFRALAARLKPPADQPLSAWVEWLEDLLDSLAFFDRAATDLDRAALLRLREVLRTLVLSEQVAGPGSWRFEAFARDLAATLERTRYQPRLDWRSGSILAAALPNSSGLRFEAVAIVGLSEGQLPVVERPDPFIDEGLRAALGLEPRIGRSQAGDFYLAVTRADQRLLITRPTLAEDGELWEPSPYWSEVVRLAGMAEDEVPLIRSGDRRPFQEAASPQEVAFLAVRRGGLPAEFSALARRLAPLRRAREVIEARGHERAGSAFEGDLSAEQAFLAGRYGPSAVWSPTRLEGYGTCPHLFFAGNLLGLELVEPPGLGPDPRQLGSLLHQLLERAYQAADSPSNVDSVVASLEALAPPALDAAPAAFGFRPSPLWDQEKAEWLTSLKETVRALAELETGWEPFAYEQSFGRQGISPLEVDTSQGAIRLAGVIDRLDRKGDQVRVIDYKTGGSHLAAGDLLAGRRLQLPVYALAAEQALKLGTVTDGLYWVIRQARPGGLRLGRFKGSQEQPDSGPAAAYRLLEQHLGRIVGGVRQGRFEPEAPSGGCPAYCPAAAWCWRYSAAYQPL